MPHRGVRPAASRSTSGCPRRGRPPGRSAAAPPPGRSRFPPPAQAPQPRRAEQQPQPRGDRHGARRQAGGDSVPEGERHLGRFPRHRRRRGREQRLHRRRPHAGEQPAGHEQPRRQPHRRRGRVGLVRGVAAPAQKRAQPHQPGRGKECRRAPRMPATSSGSPRLPDAAAGTLPPAPRDGVTPPATTMPRRGSGGRRGGSGAVRQHLLPREVFEIPGRPPRPPGSAPR
jgi:hypothetical protein